MGLLIADDVVKATRMSEDELRRESAVFLFEKDRLTLGQASKPAGMHQLDFQRPVASRGTPVHDDVEEFREGPDDAGRAPPIVIVVSDASPILSLAVIGRLELLQALYGTLLVPGAVHAEILAGKSGAATLASTPWILRRNVTDHSAIGRVDADLDDGEREAIALALEIQADLLLMDERRGRAVAALLGLRRIGACWARSWKASEEVSSQRCDPSWNG